MIRLRRIRSFQPIHNYPGPDYSPQGFLKCCAMWKHSQNPTLSRFRMAHCLFSLKQHFLKSYSHLQLRDIIIDNDNL